MFSQQELEFIKSLVEDMRGQGYVYYVARTVTESDNAYDAEIVFSTDKITADGLYSYSGISGVRYFLDSSSSRTDLNARLSVGSFSGGYTVPQNEFVYTNAEFNGYMIQPDIRQLGGINGETNKACLGVFALLVLVVIVIRIFR